MSFKYYTLPSAELIFSLYELNDVTFNLQQSDATLWAARKYFPAGLDDYIFLSDRLCPDARVVHDPHFESALIRRFME